MKLLLVEKNKKMFEIMLKAGVSGVLTAYPIKQDVIPVLCRFKTVFLDSGAYSLQQHKHKINWDKYVVEYARFVKRNSDVFDEYVELDIDNRVGLKRVEEYRDFLTRYVGREPIVVWHMNRGKEYWLKMCEKYRYLGIPIRFVSRTPVKVIKWFVDTAHRYGRRIHGFGVGNRNLYFIGFDSIDTSSWGLGAVYGRYNISNRGLYLSDHLIPLQYSINREKNKMNSARTWAKLQKRLEGV